MRTMRFVGVCWCFLASASCVDDTNESSTSPPSLSVSGSAATLNNPASTIFWSGVSLRDAAPGGEVPECASVPCDRFDLTVSLPAGVWLNKPGGVQVALRWGASATT